MSTTKYIVNNLTGQTINGVSVTPSYKIYTALLSQSGTDAPTEMVLENTLGGVPVWTRVGTGQYLCTLAGAFPKEKTFCTVTYGYDWGNQVVVYFGHSASSDYTYMYAFSLQGGAPFDIMNGPSGNDLYVEIRVYP